MSLPVGTLDSDFQEMVSCAKTLIRKTRSRKDRKIAVKYVVMLASLCSNDPFMKRNRNEFTSYFLHVLEGNLKDEQELYQDIQVQQREMFSPLDDPLRFIDREVINKEGKEIAHWAEDKSSYVAMKMLPGRGAILYIAVSTSNGAKHYWDHRTRPKQF